MEPLSRLIRKPEVLKARGQSESCFDRDLSAGLFTRPVKLSPNPMRRAVGWPLHEVEAINRAVIAGAGADQVRQLVDALTAARGKVAA